MKLVSKEDFNLINELIHKWRLFSMTVRKIHMNYRKGRNDFMESNLEIKRKRIKLGPKIVSNIINMKIFRDLSRHIPLREIRSSEEIMSFKKCFK